MSSKSMYLDITDVEFLRSGFGITLVGANEDEKSVTLQKPTYECIVKPEPPAPTQDRKE